MLHPVFAAFIKRPDLIADHLGAYADLLHQEAVGWRADWLVRAMAWTLTVLGALVFLILSGVSLMLAMLQNFHWVLVAVPGFFLGLTWLALLRARAPLPAGRFLEFRAQLRSDMNALREAAE
jgi:hypothetical protein